MMCLGLLYKKFTFLVVNMTVIILLMLLNIIFKIIFFFGVLKQMKKFTTFIIYLFDLRLVG